MPVAHAQHLCPVTYQESPQDTRWVAERAHKAAGLDPNYLLL